MMDEMAKTLARRRAQAEKKPDVSIFIFSLFPSNIDFRNIYLLNKCSFNRRIQMINNVHGKNQIHYHINWVVIQIIRNQAQQTMVLQIMGPNHRVHHENVLVALAKKQY